ncbi:hypothetical protein VTL71DRAFT_11413 [Oculimacula yallundae]|uniref:ATP-dependent DNA helicase n=1 Tax=Oculimacula yallundae TaxID=86028 RepID=A0ABR4CQE4_9HELO
MSAPHKHAAFVVFRGKTPGVYYSQEECQKQTDGVPKSKSQAFSRAYDAELAWSEWQRKLYVKLGASTFLQQTAPRARPRLESAYVPPARIYLKAPEMRAAPQLAASFAGHMGGHVKEESMAGLSQGFSSQNSLQSQPLPESYAYSKFDYSPPSSNQTPYVTVPNITETKWEHSSPLPKHNHTSEKTSTYYTPPPSSSPPIPSHKRPATCIEVSDDEDEMTYKKPKIEDAYREPVLSFEERYELKQLDRHRVSARDQDEEAKIELTPEQDKVVNLALRKNNIFMTGAAGSGKTVTLKEILKRIRKRKKGGNIQVVAPTGIAALPLHGKTTFSFAGWNPDSLRKGIDELLEKPRMSIIKAINDLDVLVVEEISMVENHFLERLNLLFQKVLENDRPFGGKQVIFLGDFHQLPPVKPFQHCMYCGTEILKKEVPKCNSQKCNRLDADGQPIQQLPLAWSDKWAFRSTVWKDLKLRHIKLEQIHRQKDERFQDILNKIRNGLPLADDEWHDLEREKVLPDGAFAVRLMSLLVQVANFNDTHLKMLSSQPRSWKAQDSVNKLITQVQGNAVPVDEYRVRDYEKSLKEHKFPTALTLKVGARVVLLRNLDQKRGLVNGSIGTVIGFAADSSERIPIADMTGPHKEFRARSMEAFLAQNSHSPLRPIVRFAKNQNQIISAFSSASLRGGADKMDQYVVTRTQIPLALAWALSIHKSQGMTLDYVEISSRDIFETGQLYVALSRATDLSGLRLTGFNRKQLPMDPHVLKFYTETKWEKLERPPKRVRYEA